ncbi:discoidin domain-containing protein [Haloferula chungangensis]|uniref:Discoidin domain-containing protein n=1 Tax=Haloferula chungangensis TaxID=1048331 RepID=A0ABW2L2B2_9BACT
MFALLSALATCHAQAGVILMPDSAYTTSIDGGTTPPMGSLTGFEEFQTVNQSGLTTPYMSGVTDFDAYIASAPTHGSSLDYNSWRSDLGSPTVGFLDFDLGATFTIESMALWNYGGNHEQNVAVFDLKVADNPDFTGATSFTTDVVNTNTGPSTAVLPQVFSITPTAGRYVRMEILANNGSPDFTAIGEVAFEVVPEPSTTVLIGLAAGLFARRRRP